ncbi:uncharacterized protein LOC127079297 [Lathyrus oleraceus]|uniref:uncharacterized protein LOC127079297 n=1 Tax=Pisum sativum TaxID=3888 RepID=UPI0021CE67E7|nr:uncharacterized protein LOC127079297 [Pisum sativum]
MEITTDKGHEGNDNKNGYVPFEKEGELIQPANEVAKEEKEGSYVPLPPYKPHIPFLQRLVKTKIEYHFRKFVEVLKKLYINIPFTEALSQMPSYAKFLKEIISNKRKLEDTNTVVLTKECNTVIQNELPLKLKDIESFIVPCVLAMMSFEKALWDLWASVSLIPLPVYEKPGLGGMMSTRISL